MTAAYLPTCPACRDANPNSFYVSCQGCQGCQARKARIEAERMKTSDLARLTVDPASRRSGSRLFSGFASRERLGGCFVNHSVSQILTGAVDIENGTKRLLRYARRGCRKHSTTVLKDISHSSSFKGTSMTTTPHPDAETAGRAIAALFAKEKP